ncbi:trafficking protein Mon1-domain-containing protein [Cantharellus anzutake]|uniref:trafficking protein Mon1-domain-containing protein n=1 Tax=Cantharellus anzutake TaxID=1750568 RepID=UPI0019059111|nr:trafficking protein Mon1-domain-containing protein [Cantharellus anzutake]KAF8339621.1 trafficking protein Mon1-domain-containing protein [Cantharellus anzutake]
MASLLGTPSTSRAQSPSRTTPSALRTRTTSLRPAHSHASMRSMIPIHPSNSPLPPQLSSSMNIPFEPSSSGSSSVNDSLSTTPDTGGMVVPTAEVEEVDVDGVVDSVRTEAKAALRQHLRETLTVLEKETPTAPGPTPQQAHINEFRRDASDEFPLRQYFVLTNAGKPVFTSRTTIGDNDLTSAMGLIQALISVFADDGDKLRSINAGRTRIVFFLRSPLYFVCVSSWQEPESVIRLHLDYLHQQILSVVSGARLKRIFERRTNFDLGRLLDGADVFMNSLIARLEQDLGLTTGSLSAVRVEQSIRAKAGDLLVPPKGMKQDILYAILLSKSLSRVITLTRPKKQSIHPSDLHILLNTLSSPSLASASSISSSSWLPICLPRYNPEGFFHVYLSFLGHDGSVTPRHSEGDSNLSNGASGPSTTPETGNNGEVDNDLGLVIVTPRRDDFERVRSWADSIEDSLRSSGTLNSLIWASRQHHYSSADLGIPNLQHFLYKSRPHVQLTMPAWRAPYDQPDDRKRLITLYQKVHDALWARSGQAHGLLKLQLLRTNKEVVMGWVTQQFEVIVTLVPADVPKALVVSAANGVTRWVKKEEGKLFIRDAPVF